MKLCSLLFLGSLLLGQLGGISVYPGAVIYAHDIILFILLVFAVIQKKIRRYPRLTRPIGMFIAAGVVSLLVNVHRFTPVQLAVASLYLVRWALYAGLYVLVLQDYVKRKVWLAGLYAVGVSFGILGLFQFSLYPDLRNLSYLGWDPHFYRLFSTFLDPNFAGLFLVLTLFLGMYFWKKKNMRVWIIMGESIALVSLLLTYSRSSYLALIAGLVFGALRVKKWMLLFAVGAFIAGIVYLPKIPGSTLTLLRRDSTVARFDNWQHGAKLIGGAPIFGHGFNTLRFVTPFGLDSSIEFITATTGFIGLAAYGYLLYCMIKGKDLIYQASFVALGIHSLFVNSAFYPWIMIWVWILTGEAEKVSGDI